MSESFFIQKPWAHQLKAFELMKEHEQYALFAEQGTGKSAMAINGYRYKCAQEKRLLPCLILCPPIVIPQWKKEFEKNSKIVNHVVMLTGSQKSRVEEFKKWDGIPKVFITNYEALLMADLYKEFLAAGFEFAIFDESHKLKEPKAKRSKAAQVLADKIKYKLILTGTPILNSILDIYQQYRILDGGKTFGNNFFAFRAQYFYDKNAGMPQDRYFPDWQPRPGIEGEVNRLIYQKAMRVEKHECMDLPPLIRQVIECPLTREQQAVYDELEEEMIAFVGQESVTASMALVKALRLQQIVSGFVRVDQKQDTLDQNLNPGQKIYEDEARDRVFLDNPRAEILKQVLEDIVNGQKAIIWAVFKQNYVTIRAVCHELNLPFVELTGENTGKQNFEAVHKFQSDPNVKVILANPKAGGVGVNLVEASYAIWYSRDFSLESDLQGEARNYRGGSEMHQKVTRIDLVTPGTIDEEIVKALRMKKKISDLVIDGKGKLGLSAC